MTLESRIRALEKKVLQLQLERNQKPLIMKAKAKKKERPDYKSRILMMYAKSQEKKAQA